MKKRKKLVYMPKAHWKETMGFDIEKEFEIYQYLCGTLKSKRKINKIDEQKQFRKYKLWKNYVEETLQKCNGDQLEEFYHFLKLNEMECEMDGGMNTSFLLPFSIAFVSGGLAQYIYTICDESGSWLDMSYIHQLMSIGLFGIIFAVLGIIVVLFFIVFVILLFALLPMFLFLYISKQYARNKYMAYFWRDYIEIVEAAIKRKNKQKDNEESKG